MGALRAAGGCMQVSAVQGARPDLWTGEGPAAATAVPTDGVAVPVACTCLGLPPRDPGSQKALPVRGYLQPEPAGGGQDPAGDGQCPQGASREETHLGLAASARAMSSGTVSTWDTKEATSRSLQGSGCPFQALGSCCRAQHTCWRSVHSAAAPAPVPSWT